MKQEAITCQSFREGCVGCCINMRWTGGRIERFLSLNTEAVSQLGGGDLRFRDMIRIHWRRTGFLDNLLGLWLVMPTFGVSALVWKRFFGSCCFAGYLDGAGRVGCLVHPARVGEPDLRRHAFPMILTLGCNRALRCGMLDEEMPGLEKGALEASRKGSRSLGGGKRCSGVADGAVAARGARSGRALACAKSLQTRIYAALDYWMFLTKSIVSTTRFKKSTVESAGVCVTTGAGNMTKRGGTSGSVLMEYVVLTTLIVVPLVTAQLFLFSPSGSQDMTDPNNVRDTFGIVGDVFVGWWRRMLIGISLPVP